MTKLVTGRKLWRQTLRAYRLHFWRYTFIVLVVTLPNTILNAISNNDATVSAYGSLAALFMNAALIYAIISSPDTPQKLRSYYYEASTSVVRYIFVGVTLALLLIPAAFGLNLVGLGGSISDIPSIGELLLLSVVGLIIASPSIYFITRYGFALIAVFDSPVWPGAALRSSWDLTRRRFWSIFGRIVVLLLGLFVAVLPIGFICIGLLIVTQQAFFLSLFQILNAVVLLPVFYLYSFNLYRALGGEKDE